jgi:hypothetical protein
LILKTEFLQVAQNPKQAAASQPIKNTALKPTGNLNNDPFFNVLPYLSSFKMLPGVVCGFKTLF